MSQTVELENCGVVDRFAIDFSAGPGVYELSGSKGVGKTTVIKSVELLLGRKVTLTVTDGELSGEVRGFGVVAPIGGKRRRRGKLEVSALESDTNFTIEDLIDPPIKDPVAADKHRIKALVSLRGTIAEPADYYDLVGGKTALEKLLTPDELKTDDPVTMARYVKEALERKAREQESIRDTWLGHAQACIDSARDVDINAGHDSHVLQADYDAAKTEQIRVQAKVKEFAADAAKRLIASAELKKAKDVAASAVNIRDAEQSYKDSEVSVGLCESDVSYATLALQRASEELDKAKSRRSVAIDRRQEAYNALEAAKAHQASLDKWEKSLAVAPVEPPSQLDIAGADNAVDCAKRALEYGVVVRQAIASLHQAQEHNKLSSAAGELGQRYREQSRGVMDILTQCVDCPSIRVESVDGEPRLVVDHPKRGKTLFAQLSDGERVRHVIDAVVGQLPDGGPSLFTLPQRTWQDLPPKDRAEVHSYCRSKGIYTVTAQVTDGEICCHQYSGGAS